MDVASDASAESAIVIHEWSQCRRGHGPTHAHTTGTAWEAQSAPPARVAAIRPGVSTADGASVKLYCSEMLF